jgi:hypothetical protein
MPPVMYSYVDDNLAKFRGRLWVKSILFEAYIMIKMPTPIKIISITNKDVYKIQPVRHRKKQEYTIANITAATAAPTIIKYPS